MSSNRDQWMAGISTGIRFRSRLEAKWAVMFDTFDWDWLYEPIDLAGYVPDFIVRTDTSSDLLVEVKPATSLDAMGDAAVKIERSGWRGEYLVVGATLADSAVGLFGEVELGPDGPQHVRGEARLFYCLSCGSVSVLNADGSWRCRMCGVYEGNAHVGLYGPATAWAEAGNRVQWRAAE